MPVFIESLDQEARGVAHDQGKAIFIDGALPGERVEYSPYRKKPNYEFAQLRAIVRASAMRVPPRCRYFGLCGGCSLQHLDATAQVAVKQRILEDNLARIGKARPDILLAPIYGAAWAYRHRARLSVRFVPSKGGALVGFHEKKSSFVTNMASCEVLPAHVSAMLPLLRELVTQLSIRDRLPQIEVAVGEALTALVLRILLPLSAQDQALIREFAQQQAIQVWLQADGPETAYPFWPLDMPELYYGLPEFGLKIYFSPTQFTQVNPALNRALVARAVNMLAPEPGETLADLFCGIGNFALALARRGASVIGVEAAPELVARARDNAQRNGLAANTQFRAANLYAADVAELLRALGRIDKLLLDPPRDGAIELVKALGAHGPKRVVYVSCNPATLARDAAVLVHTQGYILRAAGVLNMFPHTGHVESIALFER